MEIRKVGIVGAGTMGNGIAQAFATSGYDVVMRDIEQKFVDRGMSTIRKSLERLLSRNKISSEAKDAALGRIATTVQLDPMADCDLVVEAALEQVDLKVKLFEELDGIVKKDALLATNTSSIGDQDRRRRVRARWSACTSSIPCR